jgi:D-alanine-D-alanine ligase-like ATP-grasp enzyme
MILKMYYLFRRLAVSARFNRAVALMDQHRDKFYANAWSDAAETIGASISSLGNGICKISYNGQIIYVNQNANLIDSQAAVAVADDRRAINHILREENIPVPPHILIDAKNLRSAYDFMVACGSAVVVKPASGTAGGQGVSTNISNPSQLRRAIAWAAAFSRQILIERHVGGETFRLVFLDGELMDCVVRKSPRLTGDGVSTIRELVASENRRRLAGGYGFSQSLLGVDVDMKMSLQAQGLSMKSVPEAGREFTIKTVANENSSDDNASGSFFVNEENILLGRRIARATNLRLVGIDMITEDPSRPLEETQGAVVDVNGAPGFYYHYHRRGDRFPLARIILGRVFNIPELPEAFQARLPMQFGRIRTAFPAQLKIQEGAMFA